MTKQKSIISNFIYNFILTGFNLIFPLIIAPYVSRVLGAEYLGKVNFANLVVNWFTLFAIFGTATYGVRAIARSRDSQENLNKTFSELFYIKLIASGITVLAYIISIIVIPNFNSEFLLFLIMTVNILLNIFSIDWFYQGIEEYRYITIRSVFFKALSLIAMFIFVKNPDDYIIYGLISVLALSLGNIMNYIYSRKFVTISFKNLNLKRHIKGLSIMFLNTFVINIYTAVDQILLGFMADEKAVAFANRGKTIITAFTSIVTALMNVILPRASYYYTNNKEKFYQLVQIVPKYIFYISIPLINIILIFSKEIMLLLGSTEFVQANDIVLVMSINVLMISLGTWVQTQIIVPTGNEKIGLYSSIIVAIVSLLFNIMLIPKLGYIAVAYTWVLAETLGFIIRYIWGKYKINIKQMSIFNERTFSYLLAGIVMLIIMKILYSIVNNMFLNIIIVTSIGGLVYLTILILSKEEITLEVIKQIKNFVKRR